MSDGQTQADAATTQDQPNEEKMRAAYEAELNRITSSEMILQTAVSLLNIGGRRLGLTPAPTSPESPANAERDLEQVRDAIDGASALLPILERRMPGELGPLRDAVAQLQVAYAREASAAARQSAPAPATTQASDAEKAPQAAKDASGVPVSAQTPPTGAGGAPRQEEDGPSPGPAESSGRLWVPGR
jgi:hypothetical protein